MSKPDEVAASIDSHAEQVDKLMGELPDDTRQHPVADVTVQRLMTAAVVLYSRKLQEEEVDLFPFTDADALTPTEVGNVAGAMIRAADIDLFALVAWQGLNG